MVIEDIAYWMCFCLCGVLSLEERSLILAEMQKSTFRFGDQRLFIKLANVFLSFTWVRVSVHGLLGPRIHSWKKSSK